MSASDETVTTWADGFGIWHARVAFPAPGYGPAHLDKRRDAIRRKARRAIRAELTARGECSPSYRLRLEVAANDLDHMNVMWSLTYKEV